jgi:hypothetical protein
MLMRNAIIFCGASLGGKRTNGREVALGVEAKEQGLVFQLFSGAGKGRVSGDARRR